MELLQMNLVPLKVSGIRIVSMCGTKQNVLQIQRKKRSHYQGGQANQKRRKRRKTKRRL